MQSSDDLDRLLDEALSAYGNVEPRPGIESRVLRRARTPRRWRWAWAALIPALGVLLLAFALRFRTAQPVTEPVEIARVPGIPAVPAAKPIVVRPVAMTARKSRVRSIRKTVALPHESVFPTPVPLTEAERSMVMFAARSPSAARQLESAREITPIQIPDLKIQPLLNDGD